MFMQDTNSVPRTPLFTLLSIPGFLIFGASTDVALISNLIVFALASWILYLLVLELFQREKQKELLAFMSVILFNLFPGYFGMARLYMSEILQTLFVLLLTLLVWKWGDKKVTWGYFLLGVLAALGMLLRFILPVYLLVPVVVFIIRQLKLRYKFNELVLRLGLFLFGLVPLASTWYGKNLVAYWNFTRYTSYGALAEVTSLGPVWSPSTWFSFWKVIGLWHFSWPWLVIGAVILVGCIVRLLKTKFKGFNIRDLSSAQTTLFYLLAIPLPALIMTTLSVNKTARYFLPVEVFWIILAVYIFWSLIKDMSAHANKTVTKLIFAGVMLCGAAIGYPFAQSVISQLPDMPGTEYLSSTAAPLKVDVNQQLYDFVLSTAAANQLEKDSFYLIPEQVRLNDAELQWYFITHGTTINSLGEFSAQHTYDEGKAKLNAADVLIIDFNPVIADAYKEKYESLLNYLSTVGGYEVINSHEFDNGARLIIMKKLKIYASL